MTKVLLIAPTCDRDDVGEAWVAYQWAHRLAERYDVTLLTYHKRGREPVATQVCGARVIEWAEPPMLGRAERLNSMLKPAYLAFYLRARSWIKEALARGERFDIVHQPVPVAMRYPSPAAGLGIPYLIGPVGGSLESPLGFEPDDTSPWYVGLRALDRWRIRHDPLLRRTYEQAACVLGIAPYVEDFLKPVPISRFSIMSETAIEGLPGKIDRSGRGGNVRLLYVGRLIRTKGARDAVQAMVELGDLPVHLDIVGDGFDREACESLVGELDLADRVSFHGAVTHTDIAEFYRAADIFVFPSYREAGGNVAFEAMGAGLPLVVADRGGPGSAVDEESGIRLHPESPQQYATAIAAAIRRLVVDPTLRHSLGEGARRRIAEIGLWDRKIDLVEAIYKEAQR
jgi:glycosyltransferase involved in cell wall biosynthesis